jgi:hypothetical protein
MGGDIMSSDTNGPWHPIIYVRGYAMAQGEIDQTTADPFCGFNLGSTVYWVASDKDKIKTSQPRNLSLSRWLYA